MQLIKTLTVIAFVCLTAAGCVSTPSTKIKPALPPVLNQADSALLRACKLPVRLTEKDITQKQVEKLWTTDRASLIECGRRHKGLGEYYVERDNALRAKP